MVQQVALAGNPNSGKTTLFNALTGLNHRVGNYPGVTVERRIGHATLVGQEISFVDLPGTYSLVSRSLDEVVAFEALTGRAGDPRPDLVVLVLDASNLERNLYLAYQVLELGLPALVALNMVDLARDRGMELDPQALAQALGVPVLPVVAASGEGLDALRTAIAQGLADPPRAGPRGFRLPPKDEEVVARVAARIPGGQHLSPDGEALWLLGTLALSQRSKTSGTDDDPLARPLHLESALEAARAALAELDPAFAARLIEARYAQARALTQRAVRRPPAPPRTRTDRLDHWLLHPLLGGVLFAGVMALLFQSIFAWAEPIMQLIEGGVGAAGDLLKALLPPGPLGDLLADGVVGGVGNVLVFIPQIAILSFFITVLEDCGYLARAAFIMDRLMARVGLHGRAFVPLLSGFACAVPAILSARTIESRKDRLVTVLVTPLMSCSARLPVFGLMISALFATKDRWLGVFSVGGLLLTGLYVLSIVSTVTAAWVLKRTVLVSPTPPFVLELPPYRWPVLSGVLRRVYERCQVFVRDAGTMILACSVVLWALLYFPREVPPSPELAAERRRVEVLTAGEERAAREEHLASRAEGERLQHSYAGRVGRLIEPLIAPLGYDWKIGIGLLASFAAREVLVSTLGLVYGVGKDADEESQPLREALREEVDPRTGRRVYTPLVGLSLMVFFLFACQCMSTLAVVRRETGSWRWPAFMFVSMSLLAYLAALVVFQVGRALGFS